MKIVIKSKSMKTDNTSFEINENIKSINDRYRRHFIQQSKTQTITAMDVINSRSTRDFSHHRTRVRGRERTDNVFVKARFQREKQKSGSLPGYVNP